MRKWILLFLVVIGVGGATGASASDAPSTPPNGVKMSSEATCSTAADGALTCWFPAHDK